MDHSLTGQPSIEALGRRILFAYHPTGSGDATPPDTFALTHPVYTIPATNVLYVSPSVTTAAAGTLAAPTTVADAFSRAADGYTVVFRGGTYRNVSSLTLSKRVTLQPYQNESPWLSGSVITPAGSFTRDGSANRWYLSNATQYEFGRTKSDEWVASNPLADNREQIYLNGHSLVQIGTYRVVTDTNSSGVVTGYEQHVDATGTGSTTLAGNLAQLGPGEFFVDYDADRIYIGDNPNGADNNAVTTADNPAFEVTNKSKSMTVSGTGAVVRGLGFTEYADYGLLSKANDLTLESDTAAWNGVDGVRVQGSGVTLGGVYRDNTFAANGLRGLATYSDQANADGSHAPLVEGNHAAYNDVEGYGFTAGGIKFIRSIDPVVRDNTLDHNYATDIWIDDGTVGGLVVRNRIAAKTGVGISVEISSQNKVAFNLISNGAIRFDNAANNAIYNNTIVRSSSSAVELDSTDRIDPDTGQKYPHDGNVVYNNVYYGLSSNSSTAPLFEAADGSDATSASMDGASDYNAYYRPVSSLHLIDWKTGTTLTTYTSLATFQAANPGYETNSTVTTASADPFFQDAVNGDYRPRAGSPLIDSAQSLPADLAAAVGVPTAIGYLGAFAPAGVYQQAADGTVVVEAEKFHGRADYAGQGWAPVANANASGGYVMEALPDTGSNIDTGYVGASPELDYKVNFTKVGTYTVWVRGVVPVGKELSSDSVHAGLDGQAVATADRINGFSTFTSTPGWSDATADGAVATITVTTPGVHTLNLWMREDGFAADKVLLTPNSAYVPTGVGPDPSSPNVGSATGPSVVSAFSRKAQGAGTFDLGLNLDPASATVEPRLNGADTIVFTFDQPVAAADGVLDASEFALTNATFFSATVSGVTLTLKLAGVANAATLTVAMNGLVSTNADAAPVGATTLAVRSLLGDVNQNRTVTASDYQAVKLSLLKPLAFDDFLYDVNLTGSITASDYQLVKLHLLDAVA